MFLRNKMAILTVTLMSLMTIPTLAVYDNSPVNSRIESTNFDVQINTPEGWSKTQDFSHSIPETFTMDGTTYRGLQFRNGYEGHGCAIFFAEDSLDDDDEALFKAFAEAHEVAFPGSDLSTFTVSKVTLDGSLAADVNARTAKVSVKGTIEGNVARETGDPAKLTITGKIHADSTKGEFIVGTGTVSQEGGTPIRGTTGILRADDYGLLIVIWGTDEESQIKDAYRFIQATKVTKKAPVEIAVEALAAPTNDAAVVSETKAEPADGAVAVTESVAVVKGVQKTHDAAVVSETKAEPADGAVAVTESVAVVKGVQKTHDAAVVSETKAEPADGAVAVTESVAVVKGVQKTHDAAVVSETKAEPADGAVAVTEPVAAVEAAPVKTEARA